MLVQDELTTREQAIHQNNLIYAAGRLAAVLSTSLNLLIRALINTIYTEV